MQGDLVSMLSALPAHLSTQPYSASKTASMGCPTGLLAHQAAGNGSQQPLLLLLQADGYNTACAGATSGTHQLGMHL